MGGTQRLCLISSTILSEDQRMGPFLVKDIQLGGITVQSSQGDHQIKLQSYIPQRSENPDQYEIAFENADLKQALRMIATAGGFNLIVSERLDGRVSLVFHQTLLQDALRSILRVNNLDFVEENQIFRVGSPEEFSAEIKFVTKHYRLKYATSKNVLQSVTPLLSEKGHASSDDHSNIITVRDSQQFIDAVEALIGTLDRAAPQVHIEAKIVDVSRTFSQALGIQWGFTKSTGDVQGFGGPTVGSITGGTPNPLNANFPITSPSSGIGILVGDLINETSLEAQIHAAEDRGDAHIISQPSITTLNNVPAKIRSGIRFYVKTTSTIAVGGASGGASADDTGLQEIETGIELSVTPQIIPNEAIKLTIAAEESEADFSRTVDGIPAVVDNTAATTVFVKDGQTTVIGGLMKVRKSKSSSGVPVISHIPIVGWLFKNKIKARTDNELLIFITPRVVQQRPQLVKAQSHDPVVFDDVKTIQITPSKPDRAFKQLHKYRK